MANSKIKNLSPETQEAAINLGNDLAREKGFNTAREFIDDTKTRIASGNAAAKQAAKASAIDFTQKLLRLVLYQEIKSDYSWTKYEWVSKFDDERIEAGEGKEYIKELMTGVDSYEASKFVPDAPTYPSADAKVIKLYKDDGTTLEKYAFKALKPLTIIESQWFPYFISGKLMEFIDKQVGLMKQSMFAYKYTVLTNFIKDLIGTTDTNNISKRIQGTATNILSCFTNEIFPEIENMQYFNDEYARDSSKNNLYPNINNRDDLLMIMNRKTLNRFKNGVLSNTLKANLVDFNNVLPLENIIGTGKNLEIGTSSDNIKVKNEELIPENMVVVINKNLLKYLWFVEVTDSQQFVQNMSIQYVQHLWGVFGQLDWEGAFVYTNENLKTLPITVK